MSGSSISYSQKMLFDDFVPCAVKHLKSYRQSPGMAATECAKKLYTTALRLSLMYEKRGVKSLFIKGLGEAVCNNVRSYRSRNPSESLTQLARYAETVAKIADSRNTALSSTIRCNQNPSTNCDRNRRGNQPSNVSGEGLCRGPKCGGLRLEYPDESDPKL